MLNRTESITDAGNTLQGAVADPLVASRSAQSVLTQAWCLPPGTAVTDDGPRTYRFSVDYNTADTSGEVVRRERLTGEYTRGLEGDEAMWRNVALAEATGATAPFGATQKRDFMEGFRYRNRLGDTMQPGFFQGFPTTAVLERNLVWDTGMIELFGQKFFEHLKLNEPYQILSNSDAHMPEVGTFRNHNVMLEWVGRSQRNGQDGALITYKAFFNPLDIANGGMTLKGRSDYWGEIWVALETRQIEYATVYENVTGEMKLPGQDATQLIHVFRIGSLEPVSAK